MSAIIDSLPVLILYPHARCNCRCVMCDIWKRTDGEELAPEELERHLADIERLSVRWVVFSGGEPLMHAAFFRLCKLLKAKNIRITVLSTGLLLQRFAEQLVRYVDDVIVSLDGPLEVHDRIRRVPGAFWRLKEGVEEIHNVSERFPIAARCTVQRLNCSAIVETASAARALGFQSISFLAADLTSQAFNRLEPWDNARQEQIALSLDDIQTLSKQFDELAALWSASEFVLESREKLERIVQHFRAHLGLCEPQAPRCNAPWVSAVVETDGTVRPCFFQRPIGSVNGQSLFNVLNGFEAQQFRRSLDVATNPICKRCVCSLHLTSEYRPQRPTAVLASVR
ncbi:MAG TPA: radical SAM protein [Bryobacteraceae bacterium]|nr:radical SAM protein [Bryobacteraceae bacterium]